MSYPLWTQIPIPNINNIPAGIIDYVTFPPNIPANPPSEDDCAHAIM
jgi:hypothetical protein